MKDKARDLVTKKIRQASPVLLLSLVWLDCAIRAFSMIGMTKFIVMSVATVLVSLFIGFVVGFITVAISSLVLLWLYGSFWTTLLFLFSGRKLLPVSSVLSL
ncbi:unnamed protein product [Brassica oleracea]